MFVELFLREVLDIFGPDLPQDVADLFVLEGEEPVLCYDRLIAHPRCRFGLVFANVLQAFLPFQLPSSYYPSRLLIWDAFETTKGNVRDSGLSYLIQSNSIALLRKGFGSRPELEKFLNEHVDNFEKRLDENYDFAIECISSKLKRRMGISDENRLCDLPNEMPLAMYMRLSQVQARASKWLECATPELMEACTRNPLTGKRVVLPDAQMRALSQPGDKLTLDQARTHQAFFDVNFAIDSIGTNVLDLTHDPISMQPNNSPETLAYLKTCPFYHAVSIVEGDTREACAPVCVQINPIGEKGAIYTVLRNRTLVNKGMFGLYPEGGRQRLKRSVLSGDRRGESFYDLWGRYINTVPKSIDTQALTGAGVIHSSSSRYGDDPIVLYIDTRPPDFWAKAAILTTLNSLDYQNHNWKLVVLTHENSRTEYETLFGKHNVHAVLPSPSLERGTYDKMMKQVPGYFGIWDYLHDKVGARGKCLVMQDDGILFRKGLERHPVWNYDYAGAPWARVGQNLTQLGTALGRGGNGGLSLRNITAMCETTRRFTDEKAILFNNNALELTEDVYFSRHVPHAAPEDIASQFSMEQVPCLEALGLHKAWVYLDAPVLRYFEKLVADNTKN